LILRDPRRLNVRRPLIALAVLFLIALTLIAVKATAASYVGLG
jgi:hypothetical protein